MFRDDDVYRLNSFVFCHETPRRYLSVTRYSKKKGLCGEMLFNPRNIEFA